MKYQNYRVVVLAMFILGIISIPVFGSDQAKAVNPQMVSVTLQDGTIHNGALGRLCFTETVPINQCPGQVYDQAASDILFYLTIDGNRIHVDYKELKTLEIEWISSQSENLVYPEFTLNYKSGRKAIGKVSWIPSISISEVSLATVEGTFTATAQKPLTKNDPKMITRVEFLETGEIPETLPKVIKKWEEYEKDIEKYKIDIKELQDKCSDLTAQIARTQQTDLSKTVAEMKTQLTERDTAIAEMKTQLTERDTAIAELKTQLTERDATIKMLQEMQEKQKTYIARLLAKIKAAASDKGASSHKLQRK